MFIIVPLSSSQGWDSGGFSLYLKHKFNTIYITKSKATARFPFSWPIFHISSDKQWTFILVGRSIFRIRHRRSKLIRTNWIFWIYPEIMSDTISLVVIFPWADVKTLNAKNLKWLLIFTSQITNVNTVKLWL